MIPSKERLTDLVGVLAGVRLLVVGDILADEYLLGRPARLSREAPIPILGTDPPLLSAGRRR